MAVTLPLAGPVHADARLIHVAVNETADPDSPDSIIRDEAAQVQASQDYETIGSGLASYYGARFAGRPTASGALFDPSQLTAAHRSLPFGTQVQVTNPANGESVVVTINDRGPYHGNRVIDLSEAAAREIGILRRGSGTVQLAVLAPAN